MIELRWVVSKRNDTERVLQYRTGSYPYQKPHDKEWVGTPWRDVPTVTEDKP